MKDRFLQFLGLTKRAGKLLEGYNKCEDAVKRKNVHLIIMSLDASENTKDKFLKYRDKYGIQVLQGYNKEELGNVLGLEEIKILAICDKKMSERLLSLWRDKEEL
jgi:ribosomal protein L7Ae-like RNA K-turn-binding protein